MTSKEALEKLRTIAGDDLYGRIASALAGSMVYFPSDYEWKDKAERNIALKEDFYSGEYEVGDLARKYNISISRVYKIIQQRE